MSLIMGRELSKRITNMQAKLAHVKYTYMKSIYTIQTYVHTGPLGQILDVSNPIFVVEV